MRQRIAYTPTPPVPPRPTARALGRDLNTHNVLSFFLVLACVLWLAALQGCASAQSPASPNKAPEMPQSMRDQQQNSQALLNALPTEENGEATFNGKRVPLREVTRPDVGVAMPDGQGGILWMPIKPQAAEPGYMDARELRLKMRELAEQLISGIHDQGLRGSVALPVSFVHQDDFDQSSSFGRFVSEQLFYEFNQRGFPVREYRLSAAIQTRNEGEFLLSRAVGPVSARDPNSVFVVGTYYADRQAVFVNARLVRGGNGQVVRTAQLVLAPNGLTRRMLAGSGKRMQAGSLGIRDFKSTTQPTNLTPIDKGEDIH